MKHLAFVPTPLTKLDFFSEKLGCNIWAKRDDLFPEAGGGNKARMLQYILADVNSQNCDVLITAGGPCSNFNRACALMCAKLHVSMHLVEYTDNPQEFATSLNYFLYKMSGIQTTRCHKSCVPETIQSVVDSYAGRRVNIIYGGGKSIEGIVAYYDAVFELKRQIDSIDHLFVSCGTGTTLTGICAGMQELYPNALVHAISVSRDYSSEHVTLDEDIQLLNAYLRKNYSFENMIFYEDFLCGGYNKTTSALLDSVKESISKEGMIVDPCYSGKSFYGMNEIVRLHSDEYKGKNIIYWNTGGIMNLLSMKEYYGY